MAKALPLLAALLLAGCASMKSSLFPEDSLSTVDHMRLGAAHEQKGELGDAGREYGAALRRDEKFIPALIALGNLAFQRADLIEAEIYYRKALKLEPDQPSANNNLAVVYLTRGSRLDVALNLAETALKRAGPLRPYVLDTLANIYMRQGRLAEARKSLDEAEAASRPAENPGLKQHLLESRRHLDTYSTLR